MFECSFMHVYISFIRACIDTTEEGRLEECNLLGPYNLTGEYARIGEKGLFFQLYCILNCLYKYINL